MDVMRRADEDDGGLANAHLIEPLRAEVEALRTAGAMYVEQNEALSRQLRGAVSLDELLALDVCQVAHEAYLHGDTQAALRAAFRAAIAKRGQ